MPQHASAVGLLPGNCHLPGSGHPGRHRGGRLRQVGGALASLGREVLAEPLVDGAGVESAEGHLLEVVHVGLQIVEGDLDEHGGHLVLVAVVQLAEVGALHLPVLPAGVPCRADVGDHLRVHRLDQLLAAQGDGGGCGVVGAVGCVLAVDERRGALAAARVAMVREVDCGLPRGVHPVGEAGAGAHVVGAVAAGGVVVHRGGRPGELGVVAAALVRP